MSVPAAIRELARTMYEKLARGESIVDEVEQLDFLDDQGETAEQLRAAADAYLRAARREEASLKRALAELCAEVSA